MPRSTERRILRSIAAGNLVTPNEIDQLFAKIDGPQKKSRARTITNNTEIRYAAQIALMTLVQQQAVQTAINDYANSSTAINNSCRNSAPNAAALHVDQMFQAFTAIGFDYVSRITYRLMTYGPGINIPYGAPAVPQIVVGDHISDLSFVSSSENRQLLVNGVIDPVAGSRYVKMAIHGSGGVNISGGSQYNNANELLFLKQMYPKTWKVRTAEAGQAEVLYNRGTIFRVDKVNAVDNDIHVVLSIPRGVPGGVVTKNSFSGV
jgi:hypothetical protein